MGVVRKLVEVRIEPKRNRVDVIAYSASNRGTKFPYDLVRVDTQGKTKEEIAAGIDRAIEGFYDRSG